MSYGSENVLSARAQLKDVRAHITSLGFQPQCSWDGKELGKVDDYFWYDSKDYRSWSGVELSLYRRDTGELVVETKSTVGRSYFDLVHQNETIATLRKRFGGNFETDEGKSRYLRPASGPPPAPASGCYIAFNRFGHNLIKASVYHDARAFPNHPPEQWTLLGDMDPRILANNMLVPFLVAAMEDYFKSTFIALLRYSERKEAFLKGVRLQGDQLLDISEGQSTVEEQIAESLPFQRLSASSKNTFMRSTRSLTLQEHCAGPIEDGRSPYTTPWRRL